jgi:hypothetical protein
MGTYPIAPNEFMEVSYPSVNDGPVKVQSSGGVDIVVSEYIANPREDGATWTSYYELMGFPENDLTNSYLFPWYNTVHISTQMSFANVGTANTTVTVKIAGVVRGTYALAPNQSSRVKLVGINSGPVEVYSSGGVPIIASQRVAYSRMEGNLAVTRN